MNKVRKTIQEIDCFALDAILAGSFDWRELANRLVSSGRKIPLSFENKNVFPHMIYQMTHSACHVDCAFSQGVTEVLNKLHGEAIEWVASAEIADLCHTAQNVQVENEPKIAGFLWALATDPREGAQKILHFLLHRSLTGFFHSVSKSAI